MEYNLERLKASIKLMEYLSKLHVDGTKDATDIFRYRGKDYIVSVADNVMYVRDVGLVKQPLHDLPPGKK